MEQFGIDYGKMDETMQQIFSKQEIPKFSELVKLFFSGEYSLPELFMRFITDVKDSLLYGFYGAKELFIIACAAAVLFLLAKLQKKGQAAETGFYVTYLIMISGVLSIFLISRAIISEALDHLITLMQSLLPVYSAGIVFVNGSLSASAVSQTTFFAIFITANIFQRVLLPMISIYFLLSVLSRVLFEDVLSRFTGLFYNASNLSMKLLASFVVFMGALRGMLAPAADALKRSAIMKAAGAIPMVGDVFDGAAKTVLSAGVLLKNAIGVAGVIFLLFLCLVPFLQVFVTTVSLELCSSFLQPFSDKRISECIHFAAKSHQLLLRLLLYVFFMFLVLILMLTLMTNKIGG